MGVSDLTLGVYQIRLWDTAAAISASIHLIAVRQDRVRQFVFADELIDCGPIAFVDVDRDDLNPIAVLLLNRL